MTYLIKIPVTLTLSDKNNKGKASVEGQVEEWWRQFMEKLLKLNTVGRKF